MKTRECGLIDVCRDARDNLYAYIIQQRLNRVYRIFNRAHIIFYAYVRARHKNEDAKFKNHTCMRVKMLNAPHLSTLKA